MTTNYFEIFISGEVSKFWHNFWWSMAKYVRFIVELKSAIYDLFWNNEMIRLLSRNILTAIWGQRLIRSMPNLSDYFRIKN